MMKTFDFASEADSPFRSPAEKAIDRERKRSALLRAAVRLFNERGFGRTSLEDVASALGVTKPTIYHFLGNKDRVLLECITRGLSELREAADVAAAASGSAQSRLQQFLVTYARINMTDFGRCTIRTQYQDLTPESATIFRSLKRQVDHALRSLLRDAMAEGALAQTDIGMTAFTVAGALNAPAYWFDPNGAKSADQIAVEMVDILMAGLASRASDQHV
jgi:AcrR family transcriptional regulator